MKRTKATTNSIARSPHVHTASSRALLLVGVLLASGLALPGPAFAAVALPDGSIFLKQFNGLRPENGVNTYISTSQYTCGIVGLAGLDGDINEDDDGDIIYAFAYPSGGTWWVKADFRSHSGDHEDWYLDLLCVDNAEISIGGPSSKPLFLKNYTNLGDNVSYDTGFSTSSWVCGIVGFEALDGDINENGDGTIMRMYMFQQSGRWRIRADFRTHHDDENWSRIDVLCASTSVATIGTPTTSSSKQVFLKEYNGLANNGFYYTGISDSSFVCGVVGMEAYDGDIEEHDSGDIIQAYAYRQSGKWWIRTDFRTHNDHENWNIKLLCIDQPVAEDQGPCPLGCTDGADVDRNACVPFVRSKFEQIPFSEKQFKVNNNVGCCSEGQIHWANLSDATNSACHFQGIARLRQNPWIAMVANNTDGSGDLCGSNPTPLQGNGPQLFIARMGSKSGAGDGPWGSGWSPSQDQVEAHLSPPELGAPPAQWHPGGMQAVGDYLVFGIDSNTHLYTVDVRDPSDPVVRNVVRLDSLEGEIPGTNAGAVQANGVGAVKDADGHYLVVTGDNLGRAWIFRSQTENIASPSYKFLAPVFWDDPYEIEAYDGMALVRECGTDVIYLIGFWNTTFAGIGIGGTNKAKLWELDFTGSSVHASHLRTREFDDAGSAFFAGVGLYIQGSTGRMAIYSSERTPDGAFFGGNKDLDCDEWW